MQTFLHFLKRIVITGQCAWILTSNCFAVAWRARSKKASRRYVTKKIHKAGIRLLKSVNAKSHFSFHETFHEFDYTVPTIFMSNHLSLFDLPLIVAHLNKNIRVVIKKELTNIPFLGQASLASEQVVVDRNKGADHAEFYRIAQEKLLSGIALWVFPEGTRSRTGELLPFKMGCFRLATEIGAQIIPVGISGTQHILPAGKLIPRLDQGIALCIGTPIETKYYSVDSLEKLADKVRDEISCLIKT